MDHKWQQFRIQHTRIRLRMDAVDTVDRWYLFRSELACTGIAHFQHTLVGTDTARCDQRLDRRH